MKNLTINFPCQILAGKAGAYSSGVSYRKVKNGPAYCCVFLGLTTGKGMTSFPGWP